MAGTPGLISKLLPNKQKGLTQFTMYIKRIISINNGLSFLKDNKSSEWDDISTAIDMLNLDIISEALARPEAVEHIETRSVFFLNAFFSVVLSTLDDRWPSAETLVSSMGNQSIPIAFSGSKNGVTVVPVGTNNLNGGDFITNILLKVPYYFNIGLAEVSVLVVPTEEAIDLLINSGVVSDQVKDLPTETTCREQLAKFGPINQAPAIVVFYSPTENEGIIVEDISSLKIEAGPSIERTIEFAPEFYQAGVGLLSYFGEVLRQKAPDTKAKVRIEQEGNRVRLHIESPGGDIEIIEKQLEQYALVISNQASPDTLFENRAQIMQLETKLETTRIELKQAHDLKQLTDGIFSQQVRDLQQKVDSLTQQVATQILHPGGSYELL